jgi:cytochrome b6-f complex iron-sulfur subunit
MDRKEFLAQIGLGAAGLVLFGCMGGCNKDIVPTAPSNVNLTLDLTTTAYAGLLTPGGYAYTNNGIIVAQTKAGEYIAVSQYCTHKGVTVNYTANSNKFICTAHGSVFGPTGTVLNGPAGSALKQYTVTKTGNSLLITG